MTSLHGVVCKRPPLFFINPTFDIIQNMNNLGFWKKLKRPILALAPMADLTDSPFRQIVASKGRPDVFFNEFVSADGLCLNGKDSLLPLLRFGKVEHPIVAQLFGSKPENFYQAARIIVQLGFDGIDINMGCPFKKIEKQGAGAALIENPKLVLSYYQKKPLLIQ